MTVAFDVAEWAEAWAKSTPPRKYITLDSPNIPFLARFLPRATPEKPFSFLEIGCYPGRYMYLFHREFGYQVYGVDFIPETASISQWLQELGVAAQVWVSDFFHFQPGRLFDVVMSSGFIEHFPDWEDILDRHLALVAPGGFLVIRFPNLAYGQYWIRRFLDPSFQEKHFLECMDLSKWRQALKTRKLGVLYCDYFQTFRVWSAIAGGFPLKQVRKLVYSLVRKVEKLINWWGLDYPNKYFSPHIIVIAQQRT